jgi:hypothetical protein
MFLLNCYKVGLALAIALVTRWVCEAMACANGITQIQSHGKKVAKRFAKYCGNNFHEPKYQSDFSNFI